MKYRFEQPKYFSKSNQIKSKSKKSRNTQKKMFTGIVDEIGSIKSVQQNGTSLIFEISASSKILLNLLTGASICCHGVCLTVIDFNEEKFVVEICKETLERTMLKNLREGDSINLERELSNVPHKGLGGHFLMGHIDSTGVIVENDEKENIVTIETNPETMKYIVDKCFIAVNGTSLTVLQNVDYERNRFRVMLISHTRNNITPMKVGYAVNLETDLNIKLIQHEQQQKQKKKKKMSSNSVHAAPTMSVIEPLLYNESFDNFQIGIVYTEWNPEIVQPMKQHVVDTLCRKYEIPESCLVEICVPGAFEVPFGCSTLIQQQEQTKKLQAIITLGCLLKGETLHMEYVANSISPALQNLSIAHNIPIIYGILTCFTMEQALARTVSGIHYAESALQMCLLPKKLELDSKIAESKRIIRETWNKYKEIPLCFTSGKDCLAVLQLLKSTLVLSEWSALKCYYFNEEKTNSTTLETDAVAIVNYIQTIEKMYNVNVIRIASRDMKQELYSLIDQCHYAAMFMGQRSSDPGKLKDVITRTDFDWPNIYRINPILNWTYYDVWAFIYSEKLPYLSLYDYGISSMGSSAASRCTNPHLIKSSTDEIVQYKKPWQLLNAELYERYGRGDNDDKKNKKKSLSSQDKVKKAIESLQRGEIIIVQDDESREDEGDLVAAASLMNPEKMNFMIREARGLVCVAIDENIANRLDLVPMQQNNQCSKQTAFTISVDVIQNTTTGISAADRAETVRHLVSPDAKRSDFISPGHMFPLKARAGGLMERRGHTEASVDLMKLSNLPLGAVICEIMNEDGTMSRSADLRKFSQKHNLVMITVQDIVNYNHHQQQHIHDKTLSVEAFLPTIFCTSEQNLIIKSYFDEKSQCEHLILLNKTLKDATKAPLVRVHSKCFTGDTFGSLRCDCGPQLQKSIELINEFGGAVIYLTDHEGRGIGLQKKLQAYNLQDSHQLDTIDANIELGEPVDSRSYDSAIRILKDILKWNKIRLLTNNPTKVLAFREDTTSSIEVEEVVPLKGFVNPYNADYLNTKISRFHHSLR